MTKTNYQRTADWLAACGKFPGPDTLSLQLGCHIEEFIELLGCIEVEGENNEEHRAQMVLVHIAIESIEELANALKTGALKARIAPEARAEALDALCDCEVTGNGVAYLAGFDKPQADMAVLASNDAKLVDGKPIIKPGGKIGKPEGWAPPDLRAFV